MNKRQALGVMLFAALVFACVQITAFGQTANDGNIANMSGGGSSVRWDVSVQHAGLTLTVSAPDGRVFRKEFRPGSAAGFTVTDKQGERLPDGTYTYELSLTPNLSAGAKDTLKSGRAKDDDSETERTSRKRATVPSLVQSGSFSILNGSIIVAGAVEGQRTTTKVTEQRNAPAFPSANTVNRLRNHRFSLGALPDQVIPDDLIVQGSACIGLDCVNNESFGFDTVRLKENNTRIKFDDTSTSTGFPANDWQLTANDSASGGANKFSIEDVTGSKVPFTVTAGAATNSIFVDSTGRVGFRTSTPVLDLHVDTGNTPAMRLEQNSSGGFSAQTWDIAGNEANFFVRDVTGGSRLPFRIRPGAPTSSIDIAASGRVGVGTASPESVLTVVATGADTVGETFLRVKNTNSFAGLLLDPNQAGDADWLLVGGFPAAGDFTVRELNVANRLTIKKTTGRVGIGTTAPDQLLSVNGDASKAGGGSWQTFSDERLKNIKGRFTSGLSAVMRLQPIRYEYKSNNALGLKSEGEHVGFGAQSLQQIIPEAVTKNADGYLMVNNDPILWTMLNAIKEQQKEIADLKAEVEKLKAGSHRRRK
jgi:hypothetical protein